VDGANFWIRVFASGSETLYAIRKRKSQRVLEETWRRIGREP